MIHVGKCTWIERDYYDPESGSQMTVKYLVTTASPSQAPTKQPTKLPTTSSPTVNPTHSPTKKPTQQPTKIPTNSPTQSPTRSPTNSPTPKPTKPPTKSPTSAPTNSPTPRPTKPPTQSPTSAPTPKPTPKWDSAGARSKDKKHKKAASSKVSKQAELRDFQLLHSKKKEMRQLKQNNTQQKSIQHDSIELFLYDANETDINLKHVNQLILGNNHTLYIIWSELPSYSKINPLVTIKRYISVPMPLIKLCTYIITYLNSDIRLLRDSAVQKRIIQSLVGFEFFMKNNGFNGNSPIGNNDFLDMLCRYMPIAMKDALNDKIKSIEDIYKNTTYSLDGKIPNKYRKDIKKYKAKMIEITEHILHEFTSNALRYYKLGLPINTWSHGQYNDQIIEYCQGIIQIEKSLSIGRIIYEYRKSHPAKHYGSIAIALDPKSFSNTNPIVLIHLLKQIGYSNDTIKPIKFVTMSGDKLIEKQFTNRKEHMDIKNKIIQSISTDYNDIIHLFPLSVDLRPIEFIQYEIAITKISMFDLVFVEHKQVLNISVIPSHRYAVKIRPVNQIFHVMCELIMDFIDCIENQSVDEWKQFMVALVPHFIYELSRNDDIFFDIYNRTKKLDSMHPQLIKILREHFYITKQAKKVVVVNYEVINPITVSPKMMSSILDFILECWNIISGMKGNDIGQLFHGNNYPPTVSKQQVFAYLLRPDIGIIDSFSANNYLQLGHLKEYCMAPHISKLSLISKIKNDLQRTLKAFDVIEKYMQFGRFIYLSRLSTRKTTHIRIIGIVGKETFIKEILSGQLSYYGCKVANMDDSVNDTIDLHTFATAENPSDMRQREIKMADNPAYDLVILRHPGALNDTKIKQNRYAVCDTLDIIFIESFEVMEQFLEALTINRHQGKFFLNLNIAKLVSAIIYQLTLLEELIYNELWLTLTDLRLYHIIDYHYKRMKKEKKIHSDCVQQIMQFIDGGSNDESMNLMIFVNFYLSSITSEELLSMRQMVYNSSYAQSDQKPNDLLKQYNDMGIEFVETQFGIPKMDMFAESLCFQQNESLLSEQIHEMKTMLSVIRSRIFPLKQYIKTGQIIYDWKSMGNHGKVALTVT
eukprot:85589_1